MKYEAEQASYKNFTQKGNTIDLFDLYVLFFYQFTTRDLLKRVCLYVFFYIFFVNKKHTLS